MIMPNSQRYPYKRCLIAYEIDISLLTILKLIILAVISVQQVTFAEVKM